MEDRNINITKINIIRKLPESKKIKIVKEIEEVMILYNLEKKLSIENVFKIQSKKELKELVKIRKKSKQFLRMMDEHDFFISLIGEKRKNILDEKVNEIISILGSKLHTRERMNKDGKESGVDLRAFNSRPLLMMETLLQPLFNCYIKYFIKEKLAPAETRKHAVKMAKFIDSILDSYKLRSYSKFSKENDSIEIPTSSWSRLAKLSLKYLRSMPWKIVDI